MQQHGWSLAGAAKAAGPNRTAHGCWLVRFGVGVGGEADPHDRGMRPQHGPGRTLQSLEGQVLALRPNGLGRLKVLEPEPERLRCEREAPGAAGNWRTLRPKSRRA